MRENSGREKGREKGKSERRVTSSERPGCFLGRVVSFVKLVQNGFFLISGSALVTHLHTRTCVHMPLSAHKAVTPVSVVLLLLGSISTLRIRSTLNLWGFPTPTISSLILQTPTGYPRILSSCDTNHPQGLSPIGPLPPQTSTTSLGSLYCWLIHYKARDSTILSSGVIICCNAYRSQENRSGAIPALLLRTQLKNSQIEEMCRPRNAGFLDSFFDI